MAKKAAIIGSGVSGLALAARLSYAGYDTHVFEANAYAGGKLSELRLGKYRFDAGPSLFTLPERVIELFEVCGKDPEKYFQYVKLNPVCHYFFNDGKELITPGSWQALMDALIRSFPEDENAIRSQMKNNVLRYQHTEPVFLERPLNSVKSYLNFETLRAITAIPKLGLFSVMSDEIESKFKNKNLQQYFLRFATYNGSNPYKAPAVLNLIQAVESYKGAYFPVGGMISITNAIQTLAKENGAQFHFNSKVEKIITENNTATAIKINNEEIKFDIIVSAGDVFGTYRNLMPDVKEPKAIFNQVRSTSAIIFYWGIKKDFPQLLIHNVFFSSDYKDEFEAVFEKKEVANDPTVYVHISSKIEKADAPEGCSAWFVMVNAPPDTGQNWEDMRKKARKAVIEKISRHIGENIEALIEQEDYLDAKRLHQRTLSVGGSIYGNSSNSRMAAFLRQQNKHSEIKGLYFCGGSVHPGGGVPISIHSAKICANLILENELV